MHEVSQLDFHKKQTLTQLAGESLFGGLSGSTLAEGKGRTQDWAEGEDVCSSSFKKGHG